MAIDWAFLENVEGNTATAYIPKQDGKILGQSGVTIGTGIDLGQQSAAKFKKIGIDPATIELLEPYFGKKKEKAEEALAEAGLTMSSDMLSNLNMKIRSSYLADTKKWYNKNNTSDNDWSDLTDAQQTVITSVNFQYGVGLEATPNFKKQVLSNDWKAAIGNLRDFGDDYESRRHKELQKLVGVEYDGVIGPDTEAAITSYTGPTPETGTAPDSTTSDMTVATVDPATSGIRQPDPVVADASSADPMGFLDNLTLYLQDRLKSSQGGSQTPSEGNAAAGEEETNTDAGIGKSVRDRISSAMTTRRQAGEDKLKKTYEEAKKEERASGSEVVSLRDRLASSDRAMQVISGKKFDRPIPDKAKVEETPIKGESNGSKDPVFGIF